MKKINIIILVILTINATVFAQKPNIENQEDLRYKKIDLITYELNGINNISDGGFQKLGDFDDLGILVLDKKERIIYQLENFSNIASGEFGNASILLKNATKHFFIALEKGWIVFLNDEIVIGNTITINENEMFFSADNINDSYLLEGIGSATGIFANNATKLETAPDNSYWYRSGTYGSFGIIKNGKMLNQNYTYSEDRDNLIALVDGVETYYLEGYAMMASLVIKPVRMYDDVINGLVDGILEDIEVEKSNNCVSGDCSNGWGKIKFENGYYEGFSKNGKREGYGMYLWEGVGKYIGNWQAGIQTGFGFYLPNNGDQYVGYYKDGKMNGKGYSAEEGTWTYGLFENGEVTTEYHFYNNEMKTGCVAGDCKNKYGRYVFESGGAFTGFFESGHFVFGDYKFPNGDKYTGEFNSDNQFEGLGRMFFKSGSYYGGNWKNGERSGKGYYLNDNKEEYKGEWSKGELIKSYN